VIKLIGNTLFTLGQVFIAVVIGFMAISEINGMLSSNDLGEKFKNAFWASFSTYLLFRIWSYKWDSEIGHAVERFKNPTHDNIMTIGLFGILFAPLIGLLITNLSKGD